MPNRTYVRFTPAVWEYVKLDAQMAAQATRAYSFLNGHGLGRGVVHWSGGIDLASSDAVTGLLPFANLWLASRSHLLAQMARDGLRIDTTYANELLRNMEMRTDFQVFKNLAAAGDLRDSPSHGPPLSYDRHYSSVSNRIVRASEAPPSHR